MDTQNEIYWRRWNAGVKVLRVSIVLLFVSVFCLLLAWPVTVRHVSEAMPTLLVLAPWVALFIVGVLIVANRKKVRNIPFRMAGPRSKWRRKYDNYREVP